jgi:hypothetical protein
MTKQKLYTLKYKDVVGGKTKTITKTFTNLNEARKEGRTHIKTHVSWKNEKGTELTL